MIDQHQQNIQSVILNTVEERSYEIHTLMTEIAVNEQTDREAIFNATTGFNPFWFTKDILIEPVKTPIARRKLKACFKQIDKDYELGYFDVDHSKTSKRPIGRLSGEIIAMEWIYRRLVATNPKLFGWANDPWKAESLLKPKVEEAKPKPSTVNHHEIGINGKSYATRDRAIAEVNKLEHYDLNGKPQSVRFFIHHNETTDRYHPVIVGANNIDLIHQGFMVVG